MEQPVLDALHAYNVEQAYELAVQQLEKVCLDSLLGQCFLMRIVWHLCMPCLLAMA
jgi:hypothetical protein